MDVLSRFCKGPELRKDKGFVWMILVMSFLSHGLHLGFTYAVLGNLTIAHQKFFNINLEQSTLIGSVHGGVLFIFGKCLVAIRFWWNIYCFCTRCRKEYYYIFREISPCITATLFTRASLRSETIGTGNNQ